MGSTEREFRLPIISIAPYWDTRADNTTEREAVSQALHSACVEYGFFYLDISQCVDPAETEELTRLAREFFALPQVEKDKIALRHQDFARGVDAIPSVKQTHPSCNHRLSKTEGKRYKREGRQPRGYRLLQTCREPRQVTTSLGRKPVANRPRFPDQI